MAINCTTRRAVSAWKPAGEIILRPYCAIDEESRTFRLGQVSELNLAYEITEDSLADYIEGQGESASDSRIDSMALGLNAHEVGDLDVLAMLTLGERATVAEDAAATHQEKMYRGSPLWIESIPTSVTSIDATDGAAASAWSAAAAIAIGDAVIPGTPNDLWYQAETAGTTDASEPTFPTTVGGTVDDNGVTWRCMGRITLEVDTDYTAGTYGPEITVAARIYTGTDNSVGINATVTYAHAAQNRVHAAMHSGREYEAMFYGKNKALSDKLFLVHVWRLKSAPPDSLPLISTEYAGPNSTFKVLSHGGAASDESAFFTYTEAA